MNYKRWLVVMFACLGLATGFYLVGCGDDDGDGYSCNDAMSDFLSDDCQSEADAAAADLDACADVCTDEDCVNDCLNVFIAASPSCTEAANKLFDTSDCDCASAAGDVFFGCIEDGTLDASVCLDTLQGAIETCDFLT